VADGEQEEEGGQLQTGGVDHVGRHLSGDGHGGERLQRLDRERDPEGDPGREHEQTCAGEQRARIHAVHEDQRRREGHEDAEVGHGPARVAEPKAEPATREGAGLPHPGSSIVTLVAFTAATACIPGSSPI
jgi:hypothetical protein